VIRCRSWWNLITNGGGAAINALSALSWVTLPNTGGYSAAEAAMWAATNSMRLALADQNIMVVAVHVCYMNTDMAAGASAPKACPTSLRQ
jgi:NAD(P)-dependent dehydrogenase (short-subunit alcohol dehydrogenase family)